MAIDFPDVGTHAAAVIIDHDIATVMMAGQVKLTHAIRRNLLQPPQASGQGVNRAAGKAGVERVDIDIVHIDQQAAAGALNQFAEKRGFIAVRTFEVKISRQVFHQQRPLQPVLHALHVVAHHVERGIVESKGQQVRGVQLAAGRRASRKTGMVGDADRLDAFDQAGQLLKMPCVNAACRTQGQADTVKADSIVFARLAQYSQRSPAVAEKVF